MKHETKIVRIPLDLDNESTNLKNLDTYLNEGWTISHRYGSMQIQKPAGLDLNGNPKIELSICLVYEIKREL